MDQAGVQLELTLSIPRKKKRQGWGGRRARAGRRPADGRKRKNVPHRTRPKHGRRHPVHVTLRAHRLVPSLRTQRIAALVRDVILRQRRRAYAGAFQVVHFSIQDDHVHMVVEATDAGSDEAAKKALRTGISGFAISFARRLNKMLRRRKQSVWADRHHRRDLPTPTEVRSSIVYTLQNVRKHGAIVLGIGLVDGYSTALSFDGWCEAVLTADHEAAATLPRAPPPRTWLLREGWQRAPGGRISPDEAPAGADRERDVYLRFITRH